MQLCGEGLPGGYPKSAENLSHSTTMLKAGLGPYTRKEALHLLACHLKGGAKGDRSMQPYEEQVADARVLIAEYAAQRLRDDIAGLEYQDVAAALDDLSRIQAELRHLESRMRPIVLYLRSRQVPWREIGEALRVSASAVHQRFSKPRCATPRRGELV